MHTTTPNTSLNTVLPRDASVVTYTPAEHQALLQLYEETFPDIQIQGIIRGKVIALGEREVVLDVQWKADTLVSAAEFKDQPDLKVGDEVEVYVEHQENSQGELVVSRKKAKLIRAWEAIHAAKDGQKVIPAFVKRLTKGGFVVEIYGVEAFLPGSQVDVKPIIDFDHYVGTTIDVVILKINTSNNNVVVSHRAVIEEAVEKERKAILEQLKEGQVLEGSIRNITDFGLFVDLGGSLVGLVYVKDIRWQKINHPSDVLGEDGSPLFTIGKKVKVVVTRADLDTGRISLDMKQLTPHPWESLSESLQEGDKIRGKVLRFIEHGAVVEIQEGIEGLLHNDEVSYSRHIGADKLLEVGQELELVVLGLNREDRRIYLGLKQLESDPWDQQGLQKKYAVGTKHTGTVQKMVNVGAYLEFAPGIEGFLHNSNMSWTKDIYLPATYIKHQQELKVMIREINEEKRILEVSLKHMEDSPWGAFEKVFTPGSAHKATVNRKTPKGAVLQLEKGPEVHVIERELLKQDQTAPAVGEVLDLVVMDFSQENEKILVSHVATYDKNHSMPKASGSLKEGTAEFGSTQKETLGDTDEALHELKEHWQDQEKSAPQSKSDAKVKDAAADKDRTPSKAQKKKK